jgi:hypothetical protein
MYYDGAPVAMGASAGFVGFVAGELRNMAFVDDAVADYLRINTSGLYLVQWAADVVFPSGSTFTLGLYVNGVACSRGCTYRETTAPGGTQSQSCSASILAPLAALDQLSWRWVRTGGAGSATVEVLSLLAVRLGA